MKTYIEFSMGKKWQIHDTNPNNIAYLWRKVMGIASILMCLGRGKVGEKLEKLVRADNKLPV